MLLPLKWNLRWCVWCNVQHIWYELYLFYISQLEGLTCLFLYMMSGWLFFSSRPFLFRLVDFPLFICTWILKFLVSKIEFDELDFLSNLNWIFPIYTGIEIKFELDKNSSSLNSIFQTRDVKNQMQINREFASPFSLLCVL